VKSLRSSRSSEISARPQFTICKHAIGIVQIGEVMSIQIRSAGTTRSFEDSSAGLVAAFAAVTPNTRSGVAITENGRQMLARQSAEGTWRLQAADWMGKRPGRITSKRRDLDTATALRLLDAYRQGDDRWRTELEWRRGLASRSPALLIPMTFGVATVVALLVMAATGNLDGWDNRYIPNVIVGVGLISSIGVYFEVFFTKIRPGIARLTGRMLGIHLTEGTDYGWVSRPGMWESEDGTVTSTIKANLVDLVAILICLVLPTGAFAALVIFAAQPILA
jgi:hypothetical protein